MSAYNSVNGEWCGQSRRAAHRRPARRVGLRRLRHQRLDLRSARRRDVGDRRARHRDAVPDGARPAPARRDRARRGRRGTTSTAASSARRGTLLRFDAVLSAPAPSATCSVRPSIARLAREVAARSVVLLRNEPDRRCAGAPARRDAIVSPCSVASPTPSTSATVARATCGTSSAAPWSTVSVTRSASSCTTTAPTSLVRPAWRLRPTSRSSSSGTRTSTRASTSARPIRHSSRCSRPATSPTSSNATARSLGDPAADHQAGATRRAAEDVQSWRRPRSSLRLLPPDVELIRAVAAANPRTVVVIQAGSAVIDHRVDRRRRGRRAGVVRRSGGRPRPRRRPRRRRRTRRPGSRSRVPVDEADLPAFDRDATSFTYDRWHGWWHLAREEIAAGSSVRLRTVVHDVRGSTTWRRRRRPTRSPSRGIGPQHRRARRRRRRAGVRRAPGPRRAPSVGRLRSTSRSQRARRKSSGSRSRGTASRTRHSASRSWRPPAGVHRITVGRFAGDPDGTSVTVSAP